MRWKQELSFIIRRLIHRRRAERELDEEIHSHLEMEIKQNIADGMSPEEARLAARRSFGRVALSKEDSRAMWGLGALETFWQDLRYGLRMLLKNPGFTTIAVLTLALGIGANTAIFTLLDKVLIRPLPVEQPHQLVTFVEDASGAPRVFSYPLYTDLRDRNEVLAGLVAYFQLPLSLTDGSQSERVIGQIVSGNYFAALGVRPALGRFFLPEEDRTPDTHPVIVISHGLWRRRFDADPAVIGKTLSLNNYRYTVVGVAPSEFTGTTRGTVNDVYVPMMMQEQTGSGRDGYLDNRDAGWLHLIGRLKPNVSRQQAQAALALLADEPGQTSASAPGGKDSGKSANRIFLMDGSRGHTDRVSDLALPLKLLMGVVGFVLLIACANVANLLLSRASARRREIAVRLAVGASRFRIVRQLLTEYDETRGRQFISQLSERVAALPGVEAVSFASIVAFSDLFWIGGATPEGYQPQPGERLAFDFNHITPNYFQTLGARLVSGREFIAQDTADAPRVVIVNESTARRYWPGQEVVGKRIIRGRGTQFSEIVGVVRNGREKGLTADPRPAIYLPLLQNFVRDMSLTLHVRTATDAQTLLAAIRREAQALDVTLPVYNLQTLAQQKDGSLYTERLAAALLTLFGLLALSLAAVGIYGVLSYAVTERTREMGIRLALGAHPRDLLKLVVRQGMILTLIGLVIGVGAAFALTRLIEKLLFGVSATDPLTFVVIPLLLTFVALVACWIPARRATRVDPLVALRYE